MKQMILGPKRMHPVRGARSSSVMLAKLLILSHTLLATVLFCLSSDHLPIREWMVKFDIVDYREALINR